MIFAYTILVYIALPVAGLGPVRGRALEFEEGVHGNENVGFKSKKSGAQIEKSGVWAWCLKVPFAVPKTSKYGTKILVLGAEDVKSQQTSPNIWKVNAQKAQNCSRHSLRPRSFAQTTTAYNKEHPHRNTTATFALAQHDQIPPGSRCCENGNTVQVKLPGRRWPNCPNSPAIPHFFKTQWH